MIRVSRPCYNKMSRCPGWAGGGMRCPKVDRCDNGFLDPAAFDGLWWRFRVNRCPECALVVLPYVVRYLDWRWWRAEITGAYRQFRFWWARHDD